MDEMKTNGYLIWAQANTSVQRVLYKWQLLQMDVKRENGFFISIQDYKIMASGS